MANTVNMASIMAQLKKKSKADFPLYFFEKMIDKPVFL